MTRLSIIIPCLAPDEQLEDTLATVLQNRPADCEVLVVHRQPYDDPYALAGEVRFVEAKAEQGRVELVNCGLEHSQGEIAHLLGCGLRAEDGWADKAIARFADSSVGSVVPVLVDRKGQGRCVAAGLTIGRFGTRKLLTPHEHTLDDVALLQPTGPLLTAGFYRRSALEAVGWFAPSLGPLTDFDCALSLAWAGYRCVLEAESRLVGTCIDAEQTSPFETGRAAERLFWRHSSARGVGSVLAHPLEIAVDFFSQTPRTGAISKLLGRMAALPEAARLIRHARRFGEATSPPAMPSSPRTSRIRFDGSHAQRRTSAANAETAVR